MKAILLYSHSGEPVTKTLLSNEQELNILSISIQEILDNIHIFDVIKNGCPTINWTLPNGKKITNSPDLYLINRVQFIPNEIFDGFADEDRDFAFSEFRAYLAFAVEAFPNSSAKPGAFGLAGNRYSLPRQWQITNKIFPNLNTPSYYLGGIEHCYLKKTESLIYSNPFNYHLWKPNSNADSIKEASLIFTTPEGIPIICSVFKNQAEIFYYLPNSPEIPEGLIVQLKILGIELAKNFEYLIADLLFFVKDEQITFGMISNIPNMSANKSWFDGHVMKLFSQILDC